MLETSQNIKSLLSVDEKKARRKLCFIAEKYQTVIERGVLNSRMKDYYDLYYLLTNKSYDKIILKEAIEKTIAELKETLSKDNAEDIKSKTESLTQAAMKVGEHIYSKTDHSHAAQSSSNAGDFNDNNEKVVDAEFEENSDKPEEANKK